MLSQPHGGTLVNRVADVSATGLIQMGTPRSTIEVSREMAYEVLNIATGALSPLTGFMGRADVEAVIRTGRLANGTPWTIPIVLDVEEAAAGRLGDELFLTYAGKILARMAVTERFRIDRASLARGIFGTEDTSHPGVAKLASQRPLLIAGPVDLLAFPESPYDRYCLSPKETRVLFEAKGWRTVVGFQTRNVPHLGHEYVQKTALTFVDGIFINPVLGRKKPGDFKDEVILAAYETLVRHYYLRDRAVLTVLQTEMRYAGPREAVHHAIIRKNFGCTHFVVGRDHAGVGSFYPPYAAQEIFDRYPDLGIAPLFFTAFFYCRACGSIVNEKTCPHNRSERVDFSGSDFRRALSGDGQSDLFVRPEVLATVRRFEEPLVAAASALNQA
jgi:sulfate adenylyltransferase